MRTNGIDKDKERRIIDLLYDLNAKVARIEEKTEILSESDKVGRSDICEIREDIKKLEKEIELTKRTLSRLEVYFKIISATVGLMAATMLSNLDKIINYLRR